MVAFVYKKLIDQGAPSGVNVQTAVDWFTEQTTIIPARAQSIVRGNDPNSHTPPRFKKRLRQGRYEWGRMIMFQYDPQGKATLPYYDRFPMGFIVDVNSDNFLMMNFHYLPPGLRAAMMDELWKYYDHLPTGPNVLTPDMPDDSKLRMLQPYKILKRYRRLRWYKGCLKRYLNSNVQSRIVTIYPKEWNLALFMPMTRTFRKANKVQVWRDTWRKGRGQKVR